MIRSRVSRVELLEAIQRTLRSNPLYPDLVLPHLELAARPQTLEAANWWVSSVRNWAEGTPERNHALQGAIRAAQEQFDVDWGAALGGKR